MNFDMPMIIGLIVSGLATYWVYTDARSRNMNNAWMWATLTFLIIIVGLPLYLMLRKPMSR